MSATNMKTFPRVVPGVVTPSTCATRRAGLFSLLLALALAGGCARGIEARPDSGGGPTDARVTEVGPSVDVPVGGACTDGEEQPCYSGPTSTRGHGVCTDGIQRCESGRFAACDGQVVPGREECGNMTDDDCDGAVDEDCGECMPGEMRACYSGTAATMGVGACHGGMQSCTTERTWGTCLGEMVPSGMETCGNAMDDDCNGMIDDSCGTCTPGEVRPCYSGAAATMGRGRCVAGSQVCTPMREWSSACMGEVVPAAMELCTNSVDDDCDGMTDEGCGDCTPGSTRSCYTGLPASTMGVGLCRSGTQMCGTTRTWPTTCPGEVRPAAAEVCGNAADDNCNGMADEGCPACSPPPNQTCATASLLNIPGSVSGNTLCSGTLLAASCGRGEGAEVVYRFATDGSPNAYSFRMSPGTLRDPVLHMHSAVACASTNEIACNDDETPGSGAYGAYFEIGSLPANTYYVVADGRDPTDRGTFTLTTATRVVNNDTCGNAIRITLNGTYRGTTSTGKADDYSPSCSSSNTAPDAVYMITPTRSSRVTVTTAGSSFDTVLSIGTTCNGSQSGCNDDDPSVSGGSSSLSFTTAVGSTYYIVVDGYRTERGSYVLNVTGL